MTTRRPIERDTIEEFRRLEALLHERHPESLVAALREVDALTFPLTASADECWHELWDKPIYARSKIKSAETRVERLRPFMSGDWRSWGDPDSVFFIIQKHSQGKRPLAKESFAAIGELSRRIHEETRTPLFRLLRIQGAALALRALAAESKTPFARFALMSVENRIEDLKSRIGWGWGPTTVVHALTDFGLAVKTDMHLVNTVRWLGLFPMPKLRDVPNMHETVAIIEAVYTFMDALYGERSPQKLRYLDMTLLEISRNLLIPKSSDFSGFHTTTGVSSTA